MDERRRFLCDRNFAFAVDVAAARIRKFFTRVVGQHRTAVTAAEQVLVFEFFEVAADRLLRDMKHFG